MKELSQAIVTRAEAQARGLKRYFNGKPCKHGHICERWTKDWVCVECDRQRQRKAYAASPEKRIAQSAAWRKANPEKAREQKAKYLKANPEKRREFNATYVKKHPGRDAQAKGRRRVRRAGTSVALTPHQQHQVNQIYLLMRRLTLATGTQYHVDHYIPVTKGGSHAPENLWVIPAEQNKRKGSKLPVMATVASV